MKLADVPHLMLTFGQYDELVKDPILALWVLWHPDAAEFVTTPHFNAVIRALGILEYWQERGFPPHCRPIGEDDFECNLPGG